MNIHCLQHAATEGPGYVATWAAARGHALHTTHWYRGDFSPDPASVDFLVIMGGGMNVYEHRNHPWLVLEKSLIAEVIARGRPVLGICLGAQLIADVLGGKVWQNPEIELGWFPIHTLDAARELELFAHFPPQFTALHWHGDTFSLPDGATLVAGSKGCPHQAFVANDNVVGLQFHIEVRPEDVRAFIEGESGPAPKGRYIQSFDQVLEGDHFIPAVHEILTPLLDGMAETSR